MHTNRHQITDIDDLRNYWREQIRVRNSNKRLSSKIAMRAFDNSHEARLGFNLPRAYERVRYEFGALEAPGLPDDDQETDPRAFEDELWAHLTGMVDQLD